MVDIVIWYEVVMRKFFFNVENWDAIGGGMVDIFLQGRALMD